MNIPKSEKSGFSIFSVLVLMICSIVLAFLIEAILTLIFTSRSYSKLLANGNVIYKSVFAEYASLQMEGELNDPYSHFPLPLSNPHNQHPELHFQNSTDYFVYLVKNDILYWAEWSIFSGPNIPSAPGKYDYVNPSSFEAFHAENNVWSVVADIRYDDTGIPFLITKNMQGDHLEGNYGNEDTPILKGPPYKEDTMIIIRVGGSGEVLKNKGLLWSSINPMKADNVILRP